MPYPSQQRRKKYLEDGSVNPDYVPHDSGGNHAKGRGSRSGPSGKSGKSSNHTKGKGSRPGKKLSKFARADFVFWDGEGITLDDGRHVYAMLVNSRGEYILDPDGLSTEACLAFMCDQFKKYHNSIHCGFVFSYDAAMVMFADMRFGQVQLVWEDDAPYGVKVAPNYRIKYRNRKSLYIAREGDPLFIETSAGKWKKNIEAAGTIWDVFGFFQSSFVKAIESWLGKDHPRLQMIKEGKLHRGTFTKQQLEDFVLPYCLAEVETGEELMHELHRSLVEAGVKITRWDGAGAIAAALMQQHNVKRYMRDLPPDVSIAAQHAYFGGRIELIQYGHYQGQVYHYDIHSAYPAVQAYVPSMAHGHWEHTTADNGRGPFSVSYVEWCLSDDGAELGSDWSVFPFPYREPAGNVIFPYEGCGWYWKPEVDAALEWLEKYRREKNPNAYVNVLETFNFVEDVEGTRPFAYLEDLYYKRAKLKEEGRAAEKTYKLGINSTYGKTAQHTGYDPDTGRKPPFHQLAWAGYITSATRAKLYRAAMQAPDKVLFLATDGIFSTVPLDLPLSDNLGDWEYELHDEIVIIQSGVYFHRNGDKWKEYSRGFDKDSLNHEAVLQAWRERETEAYFASTRFHGIGSSVASESAWAKRGRWIAIGEDKSEAELQRLVDSEVAAARKHWKEERARLRKLIMPTGLNDPDYPDIPKALYRKKGRPLDIVGNELGYTSADDFRAALSVYFDNAEPVVKVEDLQAMKRPGGRRLQLWTGGTKRMEKTGPAGLPLWVTSKKTPTPADGLVKTWAAFNFAADLISAIYRMPWDIDQAIEGEVEGVNAKIVDDEHEDTYA